MTKAATTLLIFLCFQLCYSQLINVGILADKTSNESGRLLEQLQNEIRAVI